MIAILHQLNCDEPSCNNVIDVSMVTFDHQFSTLSIHQIFATARSEIPRCDRNPIDITGAGLDSLKHTFVRNHIAGCTRPGILMWRFV
jgi:hypothetical protein